MARLGFTTAVIVLENRGVSSAFARSWRLTSGRAFWRLLGIRFLTSLVVGFAGKIITLPIALGGSSRSSRSAGRSSCSCGRRSSPASRASSPAR